ncbi:HNH endonuclease [Mycobacteroides abscessus]|uniref:HNH endonuclease n=1 Tax=Mycobacteroides abscessus TaxID=36809 RepID=UPI000C25A2B9|nr:HNH endonuclease [Mycobacteroides abscessus]
MTETRVNDTRSKRLRARIRAEQRPCHICLKPIDYAAHHHNPNSFQLDHLWQIAHGGPAYEYDNAGASHRLCNRWRSDKIDATTIAVAARYGVDLEPAQGRRRHHQDDQRTCSTPDGQPCSECRGAIHNPAPRVTFVTGRNWWA